MTPVVWVEINDIPARDVVELLVDPSLVWALVRPAAAQRGLVVTRLLKYEPGREDPVGMTYTLRVLCQVDAGSLPAAEA